MVVFGTRAEAIKLCVLVRRLQSYPESFRVQTCVTAQHRRMLDQVLATFAVTPDRDLNLMRERQTLWDTTAGILTGLGSILREERPDLVLVQGDTTTAFAAALAAFYAGIPVGHVEAGLRTRNRHSPFPEEIHRQFIGRLADLHFAATARAAVNLSEEGVPAGRTVVTGNTIVDAMREIRHAIESGQTPRPHWPFLDARKKLIIATAHRRESFGAGLQNICKALALLARREDVQIVFPVHSNPNVRRAVQGALAACPGIELLEPLEYGSFVDLMTRSYLILSDSGGIQEEAPGLGKPVLVMRERTERPEGVEAGVAKLVGTDPEKIVREACGLLDDPASYSRMTGADNPYGDGKACDRIVAALKSYAAGDGDISESGPYAAAHALGWDRS